MSSEHTDDLESNSHVDDLVPNNHIPFSQQNGCDVVQIKYSNESKLILLFYHNLYLIICFL